MRRNNNGDRERNRDRKQNRERWKYTVGQKGYNLVSVYEREPGGPLQIEWFDSEGRHRQSLKSVAGEPVYDKKLAKLIANRASVEQAKVRDRKSAGVLLGIGETKSLGELLAEYHSAKESDWSESHKRDQRRMREFWLHALDPKAPLPLPPAAVEKKAQIAAKAKGWSARTLQAYLRYIVDAVYFAQHKLKWITEKENLSAVNFPRVQSVSKPYTREEFARVLRAAPGVDLRVAALINLAYDTGRRVEALRLLRTTMLRRDNIEGVPRLLVEFPGHTDKARKSGVTVLTQSTAALIEELLAQKDVRATGWLFPGAKRAANRKRGPVTYKTLLGLLRKVEEAADVPYVEGRGFHGIKRRFTPDTGKLGMLRAASKQSGTREETLRTHYDQDELDDKIELADKLDEWKGRLRNAT